MKNLKILFLLIAMSLLHIGCEEDDNGNNGPASNEVFIQNNQFNPGTKSVSEGTTITWTNKDNVNHTVTRQGMFDSGVIAPGGTFSYTFDTAGSYDYVCTIHAGMTGTVVAGAASNNNNSTGGY